MKRVCRGRGCCSRAEPGTSPVRIRDMKRASIGYNGATAGRRCGRRRGKRDLGVLDTEVIVVCASLLRGAVQIFEARSPHGALPSLPPLGERRNNEDCGWGARVGLRGPLTSPCPKRGRAYQPRATPWESGHAQFRIFTERRRWSHPANRIAIARANAEVAGSMWVIGRTNPKRPFITHIVTHKKAPLGRAFDGDPWPDADAPKRGNPASMLVMQGVEAGRWRRAERPRKVANRPPSTPGRN